MTTAYLNVSSLFGYCASKHILENFNRIWIDFMNNQIENWLHKSQPHPQGKDNYIHSRPISKRQGNLGKRLLNVAYTCVHLFHLL